MDKLQVRMNSHAMSLKEAFDKLGDTPEGVAKVLRDMGIKGVKGSCMSCPIAKYLVKCGFSEIYVGSPSFSIKGEHEGYSNDGHGTTEGELPKAVAAFVYQFDTALWPELRE